VVGGYALYVSLFVWNNMSDPLTNSGAIEPMMTMRGLKEAPLLGRGVVWRAVDSPLWFVYWVKMGPVQQAHTTLLFIALFGVIVVNLGV